MGSATSLPFWWPILKKNKLKNSNLQYDREFKVEDSSCGEH